MQGLCGQTASRTPGIYPLPIDTTNTRSQRSGRLVESKGLAMRSAKTLRIKAVEFYPVFDFAAEFNVKGIHESPMRCVGENPRLRRGLSKYHKFT
jgi:hypothetical protein